MGEAETGKHVAQTRYHDNFMIRYSVMVYEDLMIMMILNLKKSLGNRSLGSPRTRWYGDLNKYQIVRL
jgi:hypothetical protein